MDVNSVQAMVTAIIESHQGGSSRGSSGCTRSQHVADAADDARYADYVPAVATATATTVPAATTRWEFSKAIAEYQRRRITIF